MKKLALFIVLAVIFQTTASSQPCLPDGITFMYQAEIDNFQINHPNCTEIEGDVDISWLDINNLNGLNVLTSIGGDLRIITSYGGALQSLTGLDNVTSIGGDLVIGVSWLVCNPHLTSLTGLEGLTTIGGDLYIQLNPSLTSLTGLENVASIGGDLRIGNNGALTSLTGLDNIGANTITDLSIYDNPSLTTCEVQSICNYLVSPNGIVEIHSNASGCNNPPEIANACGITSPCLPYGNFNFYSQNEIDNFPTNYPNCTELGGDVTISGDDITNLNGLNLVTSIGGYLLIYSNDFLTSLTGLGNLTSIGGNLSFGIMVSQFGDYEGNPALINLTGLDNLTSIGGDLNVHANYVLTSLTGLDNVTTIGGDLMIGTYEGRNPNLTSCAILSICNYLANPSGIISIHDNATGCNSQQEVQDSCIANAVLIDEQLLADKVLIYPNPSSTHITIELPLTPQKNTILTIYNLNGQQLITQPITEPQTVVDVSGLPSGIYAVKVVDDKKVMMGKIVKE